KTKIEEENNNSDGENELCGEENENTDSEENSNTKILIGGSYLLNTRTKDSDIDIIIIIPNEDLINLEIINEKQFYSNLEDCNISERNCNDNSFYCLLCQDYRTNSLRKIPGRVSTINLEFLGQQFDLILVVLPPKIFLELNENNLSVKIFDGIIANFIELFGGYSTFNEKSKHLGMTGLICRSFWLALSKEDLTGAIGKEVAIHISVPMILEVNTDYPNIRQYLDWNIPNEHINRSKQIPSIFHQDLKENLYPIWPIITPGFPTQNLNFNMNISTAKIIQETMRNGWIFC
uniref:Polymerase nucleotidyl transferase domain-containing protein n=1 Tax=Meloidogyne javanica TaxID=6303 RepID=A0A915LS78_MELJA